MHEQEIELLQYLCKWTNVIPIIGRADTVEPDELAARKVHLMNTFRTLQMQPCIDRSLDDTQAENHTSEPHEPYAISSALGDDLETIDASVLMSSTYLQPLVPSELNLFVHRLFEPEHLARLRHLSATKFLLWRQENMGSHLDLQKQMLLLRSPCLDDGPAVTSTGESLSDEPSKVLVPHASSSYFRSTSPSASDSSGNNKARLGPSQYNLARTASPSEPFRQVRLAKWAQDLQRGLDNERRPVYHAAHKQPCFRLRSKRRYPLPHPHHHLPAPTPPSERPSRRRPRHH